MNAAPGLVEGLYLHGSLGWGEWYDGRSDVDFVAVTSSRPDPETVAALRDLHEEHERSFPRPFLSGLASPGRPGPTAHRVTGLPGVLEGRWSRDHGPDPVTWHELAHHGVHRHGSGSSSDVHHAAPPTATSRRTGPQVRELEEHREDASRPDLVEWFVLGIPRLHHAIATGTLTSKDGAGHHALEVFGKERWRPVVAEALTHRALGEASGMWAGREDALADEVLAFCRLALDESLSLRQS